MTGSHSAGAELAGVGVVGGAPSPAGKLAGGTEGRYNTFARVSVNLSLTQTLSLARALSLCLAAGFGGCRMQG